MDEELEQRLRGLDDTVNELQQKQKRKELQKEIELRLAKLNQRDPDFYAGKEPPLKLLSINKHKTNVEQADDLMKQFMEQVSLEEKQQEESAVRDEELEERLERLAKVQREIDEHRERKNRKAKLKKFKQTGELIHQLMMRSIEIRERRSNSNNQNDQDEDDDDELGEEILEHEINAEDIDWCSTCNEDGVIQCLDCDMEIFCKECFKDLHGDRDMRGHRTQPYKTKSST